MAYEADKVVVELIAKTDSFDGNVAASANTFVASTGKIEKAATSTEVVLGNLKKKMADALSAGDSSKASAYASQIAQIEGALGKVAKTSGNARIAQLEFTHAVRGAVDQLAAGAPVSQVFATHLGQVTQAAGLAGGGLGRIGTFMAGPWGIALTVGGVALASLIGKLVEGREGVETYIEKLKEHAQQTGLSEEADRQWAHTIDGLIESHKKLNEELGKRLQVQPLVDQANLQQQQQDLESQGQALAKERARLADLRKQLTEANRPGVQSVGFAGSPISSNPAAAALAAKIAESEETIKKLEADLVRLKSGITQSQIVIGQTEGKAFADLAAGAQLFGQKYEGVITQIIKDNPKLGASAKDIEAAGATLIKAAGDAAGAGVDFSTVTNNVSTLDLKLDKGQITVKTYASEVAKLVKQLNDMTTAAKEAAKINQVEQFKRSVIGAEGTGPNRLGSSAAGFGQFMPSTWLSYFNRLFPDKSDLSDAAKLAYRNVRSVAEGVIDKATEDYKKVLEDAGQKVTAASLYTVHILGSGDAKKFFAAGPSADTSSFLSKQVLAGNPFLKGTVAQASAAIAKRIGDSSAAVSQAATALASSLQQEKEREAQYLAQKDAAEQQVIEARRGLATTAQESWAFETAANIAAHKHTADQIAAQEVAGKLLPQEAEELRKINDERAKYRQQLVDQRLRQAQFAQDEQNFQRGRDFQESSYQAEAELLQSQENLAQDSKTRREIEQRIIDLQYAEEKLKNDYVIAWAERVKANKDATEQEKADAALAEQIAKMHAGSLDRRHANATSGNQQQNASPLQSFFQSIPNTADEINDALENIAVHGLQTFNDRLTDAIVNFTSLGDVGKAVLQGLEADMIKLALQLIEQHTIGALLGSAAIGTTTAQAAAAGAAWAGPAALASLATLGANAGPAAAALASTTALAFVLGGPKAAGGRIFGSGSDTSDNILTPTSPDEFVIKARSARAIGYDTLSFINAHGRLPSGLSPANDLASVPGGRGFSGSDMRQLESIVGRAIEAMPGISLFPTLHPAHALDAALNSTSGRRKMIDFFGQNATAIKSQINRPGS
jgi:hypothetical protein